MRISDWSSDVCSSDLLVVPKWKLVQILIAFMCGVIVISCGVFVALAEGAGREADEILELNGRTGLRFGSQVDDGCTVLCSRQRQPVPATSRQELTDCNKKNVSYLLLAGSLELDRKSTRLNSSH